MPFFISPTVPASVPILSSTGSRISTGLWALAWKYARDTSMCMVENVSLWIAAIDIMAFSASNGGVPAYKSGRSSLWNSLAHVRALPRTLCLCHSVLCHGLFLINFLIHPEVTQALRFQFACFAHCMPRQFLASDVVKAYDVWFLFFLHICQHRVSFTVASREAFLWSTCTISPHFGSISPRQFCNWPIFQLFQF